MKLVALLAACVSMIAAWECPSPSVVDPLYVDKFVGTWYQRSSYGTWIFQGFGSCVTAVYTLNSTTDVIAVKNSQKNIFGYEQSISGYAVLANASKTEGKLNVTLHTPVGDQTAPLWILSTDNENYCILYSCIKIFGIPKSSAWILTRVQNPTGDEKTKVDALIDAAFKNITTKGVPKQSEFWSTSQNDC